MKIFKDNNMQMLVVQIGVYQFLFYFWGFGIDKDKENDGNWYNVFRLGH